MVSLRPRNDRISILMEVFDRLLKHFGPSFWWPGETPLEVMVGAILTQNTAWVNVEKAIANLKSEGLLEFENLRKADLDLIAKCVRPAGYYNQKASYLRDFIKFLDERCGGDLKRLFRPPVERLRKELLDQRGIGEETADSILLYAGRKPIFVVDAYTRRIFSRIGLISGKETYGGVQSLFMEALPRDAGLYNEYHALTVRLGKGICRKIPLCDLCPLKGFGRGGGPTDDLIYKCRLPEDRTASGHR